MSFLKNKLKIDTALFICLLPILFVQDVFSMTFEDAPHEGISFKREIHIAYVEDSLVLRKSMSKIVAQYNEQSSIQKINLSLYVNEYAFINTYSSLEDVDHFDIIFTDMQMNEIHSGFLVAQHLRNLKYLKPIIVLSSDHEAIQEYLKSRNPESIYHAYSHFFLYVSSIHAKLQLKDLASVLKHYVDDSDILNSSVAYEDRNNSFLDAGFWGYFRGREKYVETQLQDVFANQPKLKPSAHSVRLSFVHSIISNICRFSSAVFKQSRRVHPYR